MNTFDLQIQSTASDGKYPPGELVKMAHNLGLATIALTDHDTVAGVAEALAAGRESGVEVIPGIELSCVHNSGGPAVRVRGFHFLGYGIDIGHPGLGAALRRTQELRRWRAQEIVKRLQAIGFQVSYDGVASRAKGGVVGRPHVALEVLENPANAKLLGGISTVGDFIKKYLVAGKPAFVEIENLSSQNAIRLIRDSGGIAVWSHPAVHFSEALEGLEAVLRELISFGLDGLEVFNPSHTEAATKWLYKLSEKYNLLRTAGSDFHREPDPGIPVEGGSTLGDFETYGLSTDDILPRLRRAMASRPDGRRLL